MVQVPRLRISLLAGAIAAFFSAAPAVGQSDDRFTKVAPLPRYWILEQSYHVFSNRSYYVPAIPVEGEYRENARFIEDAYRRDPLSAFSIWKGAVAGSSIAASKRAVERLGPELDWDYLVLQGEYSRNAEEAGNFNYAVTGHRLFTVALERAGLDAAEAEMATRWILRLGGGAYQALISDTRRQNNRWNQLKRESIPSIDSLLEGRTWYFEAEEDVEAIEAGMDYDRFLRLDEIAQSLHLDLRSEDFGFDEIEPRPRYRLMENLCLRGESGCD